MKKSTFDLLQELNPTLDAIKGLDSDNLGDETDKALVDGLLGCLRHLKILDDRPRTGAGKTLAINAALSIAEELRMRAVGECDHQVGGSLETPPEYCIKDTLPGDHLCKQHREASDAMDRLAESRPDEEDGEIERLVEDRSSITKHIKEWRDSVDVGTEVAIYRVAHFASTVFPDGAPLEAVVARLFPPTWPEYGARRIEGVEGYFGAINNTKQVRRTS